MRICFYKGNCRWQELVDSVLICDKIPYSCSLNEIAFKQQRVDEQFIFEVTCWKCWDELVKECHGVSYEDAKYPFKVDTHYLHVNKTFHHFCGLHGITKITEGRYKCSNCGYKRWTMSKIYYPYLYLWLREREILTLMRR